MKSKPAFGNFGEGIERLRKVSVMSLGQGFRSVITRAHYCECKINS